MAIDPKDKAHYEKRQKDAMRDAAENAKPFTSMAEWQAHYLPNGKPKIEELPQLNAPTAVVLDDERATQPDTGNAEADRIINRLSSSDPDFDDCVDAAAFIRKLVAEHKGPDGFATWKDAAIAERMLRVKLEAATEEDCDTLRLAIGYIGSSGRTDRMEHVARLRAMLAAVAQPVKQTRALTEIRQAIADYHFALDLRAHGGVAQDRAFNAICKALGMHWTQGEETKRRVLTAARPASGETE